MKHIKASKKGSKYDNRPSPPISAQDYPNKIKKGNDGKNYRSEKDKNGVYRWKHYNSLEKYINDPNIRLFSDKIKTSYPSKKNYMIHDNGGRPFYVEIFPKEIKIFKATSLGQENDGKLEFRAFKFFKSFEDYEKIFIGKSPINEMTKFSGGHGKEFDGNSILVKLKENTYLYIGMDIYTFESGEEIIGYESSVGNNDVPYPIGFSKNNVYLMIEYVYYPKEMARGKDAYSIYYGNDKKTEKIDEKKVKKFKHKKMVHKRHEY